MLLISFVALYYYYDLVPLCSRWHRAKPGAYLGVRSYSQASTSISLIEREGGREREWREGEREREIHVES